MLDEQKKKFFSIRARSQQEKLRLDLQKQNDLISMRCAGIC